MKHFLTLSLIAAVAMMTAACTGQKAEPEAQPTKSLILYYSQTGATKAVADELQRLTGADIEAIDVTSPYDGNYDQTIERVQKERTEGILPTLRPMQANLCNYDTIYLGYPIWFGTYAPPIAALIDELSLEGKTIVPFCTFGSGGLEATVRELRTKFPDVNILDGYGVRNARLGAMPGEVERFLKENNIIAGNVEPLPDFSELQPVTLDEAQLFDLACGDYPFKLGTPIRCAQRPIDLGTEYQFLVKALTPDGQEVENTIYINHTTVEGDMVVVEFTRVVR